MKKINKFDQSSAYKSPWSLNEKIKEATWIICYILFFRFTPKYWVKWRNRILSIFGAKIHGTPYVAPSAKIKKPWNLVLEDRACIGPDVDIYNLGIVAIGLRSTVSQQTYICNGSHDLSLSTLPLITSEIVIGDDVFIGARVLILLGVKINNGAVVGAGSVVSKDIPEWMICAGNPCKPFKARNFKYI